jgi:hypothetical protein
VAWRIGQRPLRVNGRRGRQADGIAGLPPVPKIAGAFRHLRFVPVAAIEDDGTILYSILTCSLSNASPKVYPG